MWKPVRKAWRRRKKLKESRNAIVYGLLTDDTKDQLAKIRFARGSVVVSPRAVTRRRLVQSVSPVFLKLAAECGIVPLS